MSLDSNRPVESRGDFHAATGREPWYIALTPIQRLIVAVCWTAKQTQLDEIERKRLYEEAIYGRP